VSQRSKADVVRLKSYQRGASGAQPSWLATQRGRRRGRRPGPPLTPTDGVSELLLAATDDGLPCWSSDPELFFADSPADIERAKAICRDCPVRLRCLAGAIERREPWGVWGGEYFTDGAIVAHKRPRGRPRKQPIAA
jgi:WhiB family transcriptional regulator, redox-sensing transcriptional regulator